MSELYLDIVPDGDVIVVLRKPNSQHLNTRSSLMYATPVTKRPSIFLSSSPSDTSTARSASPTPEPVSIKITEKDLENLRPVRADGSHNVVWMRVSSAHMMRASSVFRQAILDDPLGAVPTVENPHRIETSEWNAHALYLILKIIHGDTLAIPQEIGLLLLSGVTAIVDHYECQKAVSFFAHVWIARFMAKYSNSWGYPSAVCLYIASVFDQKDNIRLLSKRACLELKDLPLSNHPDFTVPSHVEDPILKHRVTKIQEIYEEIDSLTKMVLHPRSDDPVSHAIYAGTYMVSLQKAKLTKDQRPDSPYNGQSVSGLIFNILKICKASRSLMVTDRTVKSEVLKAMDDDFDPIEQDIRAIKTHFEFPE